MNKISSGDALALGDLQHFNDGVFYRLPVRLSGWVVLSNIIYYSLPPFTKVGIFINNRRSEVLAQGVFEASQLHPQISDHPARRIVFAPPSPFWKFLFCRDIQPLSVQKCTLLLPVNRLIKKLTRERVSFFMNRLRELGFIHYNGGLQVHSSLLHVVLHD